jgi:hypothetical protein
MSVVCSVGLIIVQVTTKNLGLALFSPARSFTWLVPLSVSVLLSWVALRAYRRYRSVRQRGVLAVTGVLAIMLLATGGGLASRVHWEHRGNSNYSGVIAYGLNHQASGQLYLIPSEMEEFRLAAQVPVFVDWKSIPYKDVEVLEWHRRLQLSRKFYSNGGCADLAWFAREGVTHVVLPISHPIVECDAATEQYRDEFLVVMLVGEGAN